MEGKIKKKENVRYEEVAQQLLSVNVSKASLIHTDATAIADTLVCKYQIDTLA